MLNKKQLKESIMRGVAKNLKLNEGFSSWREENAPSFPEQKFLEIIDPFIKLLDDYLQHKYINSVMFRLGANQNTDILLSSNTTESYIKKGMENLNEKCIKGRDQFYRLMYKTYLQIQVNNDSVFGNYVKSTVNHGGSEKIIDMEDVMEYVQNGENPIINIPTTSFLDSSKFEKLNNYFS